MSRVQLTRYLAIALVTALLVPAGWASTVASGLSPSTKAKATVSAAAPAAPHAPAAQAASRQPTKPHHHWPRVSLLKTIIIVGIAAAVTGIVVWRSHKTECTHCVGI
ncbi:MAG: hypothetical protein ACRD2H_11705 [Terriglobales bacterium]